MQTINLDLSVRSIIPLLHAKQGDVGRKFKAILRDGGAAYPVPAGAAVSVWYSGTSGEGNYTDIGADSAVSVSGNEITVELITQMLANYGEGKLCLAINTADGDQIGTWNIPYMVEPLPGMGSAAAQQYFTAFSQAVENLPYPDPTLSVPGRAADAGAVGTALAGKAPDGYGLGGDAQAIDSWRNATRNGFYRSAKDTPDGDGNEWHGIVCNYSKTLCNQLLWKTWGDVTKMATRRIYNGVPGDWVDCSPSAFAPSGFGLGENAAYLSDYNAAVKSGFYYTDNNTQNKALYAPEYCSVYVINAGGIGVHYKLVYGTGGVNLVYYSTDYGSTWVAEWVNPQMNVGGEYRTTERYNGKPVYTRLWELGTFSYSEETNMTPDGIDFGGTVIDYYGYIANSEQFRALPFPMMDVWVSTNNVTVLPIGMGSYYTGWKLYLVVKTVKD